MAAEQPARVLRDAGLDCIRALVRSSADRRTAAIGLTGQMHGLVALDEHLEPLRPILSCVDFRNEKQNDEIYAKVGGKEGLLPYTNNKMVPSCTAGKILWMRENEPALFARTRVVVNPKDYVRTVLTGVPATDESDASGFGVYDVRNHRWNRELLDLIGLPEEVLPPVLHADQAVGTVLPEVAAELGLGPDTVVVAGAGDAIMQTVGSGAVEEGVYSVVLGSGGLISTSLGVCAHNEGAPAGPFQRRPRPVGGLHRPHERGHLGQLDAREPLRGRVRAARKRASGGWTRRLRGCAPAATAAFFPSLLGQRNPVDDPTRRA
ncbi:MAG: FGGY family carbohydrate kinase [Anaerotruncus massiliensis (ex Togo et al. 2019)]